MTFTMTTPSEPIGLLPTKWVPKRMGTSERRRFLRFRDEAFIKQDGRCFWCMKYMNQNQTRDEMTCTGDHLYPRRWGGPTTENNIVAACYYCNSVGMNMIMFVNRRVLNANV